MKQNCRGRFDFLRQNVCLRHITAERFEQMTTAEAQAARYFIPCISENAGFAFDKGWGERPERPNKGGYTDAVQLAVDFF